MADKVKYPSTPHVSWSPGTHRDDSYHEDEGFLARRPVVVTEKMDGENTTIYSDAYHARSLDTPYHPSREWVGRVAGEIGYMIPDGWRVCGENVYAKHSIEYDDLRDYFQVFSVWNENNFCLSWRETYEWASLLGLDTVPVLYEGAFDRALFESWDEEDVCEMAGRESEGYVIRTAEGFPFSEFGMHMAKWVRENHVRTDEHWLRQEITRNRTEWMRS
jgi:hypothetical protein